MTRYFIIVFLAASLLLWSVPAQAYVGPAIAFVGYLFGPIAAVIATVGLILSWPAMKLYRKIKSMRDAKKKSGKTPPSP